MQMNHSPYHVSDENHLHAVGSDFFFDEKTVLSLDTQSVEQAKGHLVLLGSSVENFLKLATLIDGSSVDFLFGVRYTNQQGGMGRSRANEVKKFIRSLDSLGQEAAAEFYFSVYNAVVEYYEAQRQCCAVLCRERSRRAAFDRIDRALDAFLRKIKNQRKQ